MPPASRVLLALVATVAAAGIVGFAPRPLEVAGVSGSGSVLMTDDAAVEAPVAVRARPASTTPPPRSGEVGPPVVAMVLTPHLGRSPGGGLRMRLDEAGDRWRALLLGAPPAVR